MRRLIPLLLYTFLDETAFRRLFQSTVRREVFGNGWHVLNIVLCISINISIYHMISVSNIILTASDTSGKNNRVVYQDDLIFGRNTSIVAEEWYRGTAGRHTHVCDLR